ncbi:MAG: DUF2510 domain-containing protein [Acidimicrobiales bacterium]
MTGPGAATPGWYHAEGDPLGTERYWNGSEWTEGPRPVGGVPPAAPGAPATPPVSTPAPGLGVPPMAAAGVSAGMPYQESRANMALGLSIFGLLCCGPAGAFGMWKGLEEKRAIQEGRRDPANEGKATAAVVIGGIAVALLVLGLLFLVIISATA